MKRIGKLLLFLITVFCMSMISYAGTYSKYDGTYRSNSIYIFDKQTRREFHESITNPEFIIVVTMRFNESGVMHIDKLDTYWNGTKYPNVDYPELSPGTCSWKIGIDEQPIYVAFDKNDNFYQIGDSEKAFTKIFFEKID